MKRFNSHHVFTQVFSIFLVWYAAHSMSVNAAELSLTTSDKNRMQTIASDANSVIKVTSLPVIPGDTIDWSSFKKRAITSTPILCGKGDSNVCFKPNIESSYADNQFSLIWQDRELRQEFEQQLRLLAGSQMLVGLDKRIVEMEQLKQEGNDISYDLLATDTYFVYRTFQKYIAHHPDVLFTSKPIYIDRSVSGYGKNEKLHSLSVQQLKKYRPRYIDFAATLDVIKKLSNFAPHQLTADDFKRLYLQGDVLPNGHAIIAVLHNLGDISQEDYERLNAQSKIKNVGEVFSSIKKFQQRNVLVVDGILGPNTVKQLIMPYSEIARRLALNTLRVATLVKHNNARPNIWVNIPNYTLEVFDKGEVVFESKIIVGRNDRPTNLFSSTITTMVVNPYWNIPVTIKQHDVIPKVKHSRDYLQQHNMKILKSWRDRTIIPPSSIDWENVNPETFPYEFQQGPGPKNSLGRVKFLMPNDYSIFLHDTPQRGLFDRAKRDLSSGCVRVERAHDLANYVIDYQKGWDIPSFETMLDADEQKTVSLYKRIDVNFVYLTAWVDNEGRVQMREDIYGYDLPRVSPINSEFITMKNFVRY